MSDKIIVKAKVASVILATAVCVAVVIAVALYPPDTAANMEHNSLSGITLAIQDSLAADNWQNAIRWMDLLETKWKAERQGLRWRVFGSALNDVDVSLARLKAAAKAHDLTAAMVESAELMTRVRILKR